MNPLCARLRAKLPSLVERCHKIPCLVGFDGTVDVIYRVVQQRTGPGSAHINFSTIGEFGRRIVAADDESALLEVVPKHEKIGGNGPILANALLASGVPLEYIGTLGGSALHPAYAQFAAKATVHRLGEPAITHAMEFDNGKIMLSTLSNYERVSPESIRAAVGIGGMIAKVAKAHYFGLFNWTCMPFYEDVLDWLLTDILPEAARTRRGREIIFFFDLTDPSRRSSGEIVAVVQKMAHFGLYGQVVLGLNYGEVRMMCRALGLSEPAAEPAPLCEAIRTIRKDLGLHMVMAHPSKFACCASADGVWTAHGPYTPNPTITTGAGDHLNAGFSLGLLLELPVDEALQLGTLFSGFYVREARPPALAELPAFIDRLDTSASSTETDLTL